MACVEHARAVTEVRKIGQVVKTKDGNAIQNPFLPIVNRQALIMLKAGAEMGFSPAARASLGAAAPALDHVVNGIGRPRAGGLADYIDQNPDRIN